MTTTETDKAVSKRLKLADGKEIPQIHLGVYMTDGKECITAVKYALDAGYRAFDSAEWYYNEAEVGQGIREWLSEHPEVTREDIFFTTKLKSNESYAAARKSIKTSLKKCGLGYIDLYLLHSPYGGKKKRLECWGALMDACDEGEVRSIGVSNFGVQHLEELLGSNPRIKPVVNQVELHPFNTRTNIVDYCNANSIMLEAYAPLVRGLRFSHPLIYSLATKYSCTSAQLLIRWGIQKGFVVLPKSVRRDRIQENASVDGFEISEEDMQKLDACDEYLVTDWDPTGCE